jgi:formylglycine-generating enzyme required for sulfatase activity
MIWTEGQLLRFGKYQIIRRLGGGGFGVTYLAQDLDLARRVVIKAPNRDFEDDLEYETFLQRFRREGRRLAAIDHPNVVRVIELFEEAKIPCLVMEYVQGETLEKVIKSQGCLSEVRALQYFRKLAEVLQIVHEADVIHCDLHPGNIMLRPSREPVLIDFGSAHSLRPGTMTMSRTETGYTPYDQRDGTPQLIWDVYGLAAALYFTVTGKKPEAAINRKLFGDSLKPPQRHKPELSDWLNEAILKGMALEPHDRPPSMEAWAKLLTPPKRALKSFAFEVVTVDRRGKQQKSERKQAEYFAENLSEDLTLDMVAIPGGTFQMGSNEYDDEKPIHSVTVAPFFIGKYPVTQAQYEAIMGNNPAHFKGEQRPVEEVSWDEAIEFCDRLSQKTGKSYRLPSEAEWEYACRAGTTTPFSFGETITTDLVNYDGNYPYGEAPKETYRKETTDVGSFPANAFGLFDLHGNVWEWCLDRWHENYQGAPIDGSAWLTENDNRYQNESRLLRGGSWFNLPRNCRSANRYRDGRDYQCSNIGFRVVCAVSRIL